ncbi:MAG TPA: hypothetical protein VIG54_08680 [Lysobacter sp.]
MLRHMRRPLALLSVLSLAACWFAIRLRVPGKEPSEDLALSIAMLLMVGLAPLFNLFKGLGASRVARSWGSATVASLPAFAAAAVCMLDALFVADWIPLWCLMQLVVLPVAWAIASAVADHNAFDSTRVIDDR